VAITTYSELLTAVSNWSGRSDLSSRTPEFIALFEAKINRLLATKEMETKDAAYSITGEYVAAPTGMARIREFYLNTDPKQTLSVMAGDVMTNTFGTGTGKPKFYEVVGSNIRFGQVPDGTYTATIIYSKAITGLTVSNTTNWLLTSHPDVYLYGVLAEMAVWIVDMERAQAFVAMSRETIEQLRTADRESKWGGNSMAVRLG